MQRARVGGFPVRKIFFQGVAFRSFSNHGASSQAQAAPVYVYISNNTNPFFNLAYEEFLFRTKSANSNIFFWWRNEPSIIIGRFQNPWKEVHMPAMEQRGVHLVRRKSGGGTVYQDLGNSIFSFIGPKSDFSAPKNNQLLIDALASVGVAGAQATGRNDMELEGRKISGAAFKHSNTTSLHHGTLLVDVEMNALSQLLNPNKAKLASKGVASVAARVVNLKTKVPELDHWQLGRAAINSFLSAHNSVLDPNFSFPQQPAASTAPRSATSARSVVTPVVIESHVDHADFKQPHDELMDWSWRFGRTPSFTHSFETRFPWGVVDVNLQCEGGKITEALVYSDCLYTALIESVRLRLVGQAYNPAGIRAAMALVQRDLDEQQSPAAAFVGELCDWIVAQL